MGMGTEETMDIIETAEDQITMTTIGMFLCGSIVSHCLYTAAEVMITIEMTITNEEGVAVPIATDGL